MSEYDKSSKQGHIDEIMDYFDFNRVHKAMKHLNWKWETNGVPSVAEIRSTAREKLNDTWDRCDGDSFYIKSGGLSAECFKFDGKKYLELRFELDSWDTCEQ